MKRLGWGSASSFDSNVHLPLGCHQEGRRLSLLGCHQEGWQKYKHCSNWSRPRDDISSTLESWEGHACNLEHSTALDLPKGRTKAKENSHIHVHQRTEVWSHSTVPQTVRVDQTVVRLSQWHKWMCLAGVRQRWQGQTKESAGSDESRVVGTGLFPWGAACEGHNGHFPFFPASQYGYASVKSFFCRIW